MRNESQVLRHAQRLAAVAVLGVCLPLAGCRQWAAHDHDGHDHLAHDHASEISKPKKQPFNLDSLRDERAVAVDRHMDGKTLRMAGRKNVTRNPASLTSKGSPLDEDPANAFLPATESESTDR
jgi:hypothetical protein